jgi:surface polysaccharide O-acyltransferase-like enzyme
MQPEGARRYHSLDALRAAMMLLGLVLHSGASYTRTSLGDAWPYQDAQTSVVFDLLLFLIHVFRMPVFFIAAGFFGALLYGRDGARGFARNRMRRVLLPFLIFWATVMPLAGLGVVFTQTRAYGAPLNGLVSDVPLWRQPILGHLWFLYDLLIFYTVALAIVPLARRAPAAATHAVRSFVRASAARSWGVLLPVVVTAATLLPMTVPVIEGSASPVPAIRGLVAYGVFFAFGWLLHAERHVLGSFAARWKRSLALGIAFTAAHLFVLSARDAIDVASYHVSGALLGAASIWLLSSAAIGVFVRHVDTHRPLVRYLSDASYWMYLVHILPTIWVPGMIARSAWPAGIKFGIVLGATAFVTLITYHYLVRSTAAGALLNGRRYPRREREEREAV